MLTSWTPLLWSLILLALLWLVRSQLSLYLGGTLFLLTRSSVIATYLSWIFTFPGTLVHETSHWLAAKLVGVRTGKVTIMPRVMPGGRVQLGSVEVFGIDAVRGMVVGLAPLVVCSLLTLTLAYSLVDVPALTQAWQSQEWETVLRVLAASLRQPDALLGLYLLFTISDAIVLSDSDLQHAPTMLFYLGLLLAVLYVVGWLPVLPGAWSIALQNAFRVYASGLAIAVLLHFLLMLIFAALFHVLGGEIR